jgi:hypothetical protein
MLLPGPTGGPRRHCEVRVEATLLASGDSLGGAATRSGARPSRALASDRLAPRGSLAGGRLARDGLPDGLAGDGLATSRRRATRGRLAGNGLAGNGLATRCRLASRRLASLRSSRRLATSRRLARCGLRGSRSCGYRRGHDLGTSRGLATRCLASGGLLRTRRRLASCRRTSAFARARRGLPGLCCRHEQPPGAMSRYEYGGAYIHRLNQMTYGT